MRRLAVFILLLLITCGSDIPSQLKPLLILPEDLSPHLGIGNFEDLPVLMFGKLPPNQGYAYRRFLRTGSGSGGVAVMLYDNEDVRKNVYETVLDNMIREDSRPEPDIGEQSAIVSSDELPEIVFIRCRAVVHIRMYGIAEDIVYYAKRLDSRITPIVCA